MVSGKLVDVGGLQCLVSSTDSDLIRECANKMFTMEGLGEGGPQNNLRKEKSPYYEKMTIEPVVSLY